ncbi:MAG TPA: DUF480 domain-containing protein [Pseudomonadales bacterium]|nr:DUF480 domain-containing protein [Pseudomonadales bacterium]
MSEMDAEKPVLTPVEARILGCLVEKQATTPETYPLTLNALVIACNQKTSREPVMNLDPGEVGQALRVLDNRHLTSRTLSSRADRWEHKLDKALDLPPGQLALMTIMLLRGPQTLNELLTRTSRLHQFSDVEQLSYQLERMAQRNLVVKLPRQTGQREDRYMHLLCGPVDAAAWASHPTAEAEHATTNLDIAARVEALEARVAELEARIARLEGD